MSPADYIEAAATSALLQYASGILGNSVSTTVPPGPAGTYLRESAVQAGIDTSANRPAPFIICYDFTTAQADTTSRVESAAATLYFADTKPGQGDSPAAHHDAEARMTLLKQRFLASLDANPLVLIAGMRATPFADAYAAKLDGVGVQFTLTVPAVTLVADCV